MNVALQEREGKLFCKLGFWLKDFGEGLRGVGISYGLHSGSEMKLGEDEIK